MGHGERPASSVPCVPHHLCLQQRRQPRGQRNRPQSPHRTARHECRHSRVLYVLRGVGDSAAPRLHRLAPRECSRGDLVARLRGSSGCTQQARRDPPCAGSAGRRADERCRGPAGSRRQPVHLLQGGLVPHVSGGFKRPRRRRASSRPARGPFGRGLAASLRAARSRQSWALVYRHHPPGEWRRPGSAGREGQHGALDSAGKEHDRSGLEDGAAAPRFGCPVLSRAVKGAAREAPPQARPAPQRSGGRQRRTHQRGSRRAWRRPSG
mmetsp:Transcript_57722/g.115963  ORF Transcript_57722/g.115963 Transcript_57722/m.115963 type:complete len:266 (+) Transcript_57722:805-1602(+)